MAGAPRKGATLGNARIAQLVLGVDIRALPIGPEEAFVISRIDGNSGDADIALGTGLSEDRVREAIDRLRELGAVRFHGEPEPPRRVPEQPRISETPSTMRSPKQKTEPPAETQPSGQTQHSLDEATRAAIDQMLARLERVDHYQLLGVSRSASKKEIKGAYFSLIARFHPDKYYGTELGESKGKLERAFARLTEAYDTLTRSQLRAAYDSTLPAAPPSAAPTASSAPGAAETASVDRPDSATSTTTSARESSPSTSGARPAVTPVDVRLTDSNPTNSGSTPSLGPARRRALARKLQGSLPPNQERVSTTLQAVTAFRPSAARKADTIPAPPEAPQAAHHRFLIAADRALEEDNPVAATNALRLALAAKPDDPAIQRRLEQAQQQADVRLQERLKLDGGNAQNAGRFSEAAQLFGRAARAGADADLYLTAAECSLKAQENPKIAADFAKRGLSLSPDHARLRVLLGRIYADAGMTSSAVAELEKARKLRPSDDNIRALLEKVRKG